MFYTHTHTQWYYALAIVEDLIFRSLWTLNISVGEAGAKVLEGNILGTILAVMEIFRRFIWNFFRVENEHLNNCGDFRVVRDISIHPINPAEVLVDDEEEGVEPELREHLAREHRKLSLNLAQVRRGMLVPFLLPCSGCACSLPPAFGTCRGCVPSCLGDM